MRQTILSRDARVYTREGFLQSAGHELADVTFSDGGRYLRLGSSLLFWGDLQQLTDGGFRCLLSGMTIRF
jgi:hypothetical protein